VGELGTEGVTTAVLTRALAHDIRRGGSAGGYFFFSFFLCPFFCSNFFHFLCDFLGVHHIPLGQACAEGKAELATCRHTWTADRISTWIKSALP